MISAAILILNGDNEFSVLSEQRELVFTINIYFLPSKDTKYIPP